MKNVKIPERVTASNPSQIHGSRSTEIARRIFDYELAELTAFCTSGLEIVDRAVHE